MKTILLIRHAKSSWSHGFTDIERPLADRGYMDAKLLSKKLLNFHLEPDAIFSSPAIRALTTCNIFMETLRISSELMEIKEELYDFEGGQVAHFIHNLNDTQQQVMIFGHNYAFTEIANNFGDKFIDNVPTCGLVMLQFDEMSWKNVDKGHTKMTLFPKDLKE